MAHLPQRNPARNPFRSLAPVILAVVVVSVRGSDEAAPQLYDLTTETTMPHLEENLRYTTTNQRQCLALSELAAAFPILRHPALEGCKLDRELRQLDSLSYQLVCTGGHGTTGSAVWHLGEHRVRGTLDVKLGGKNMTFSQTITAIPLGKCP
jgi:hypothetical protein